MNEKLDEKISAYYPCDICGHDSPSNKQRTDKNGVRFSYCLMHWWREIDDFKLSIKRAEEHEKFKSEFRKAFENPTY